MDLRTTYMGLALKNPIVPSASPLSESLDSIKMMEDAGAAAVVMFSIFEEQLEHEIAELAYFEKVGNKTFPDAVSYLPKPAEYHVRAQQYLELIRSAVDAVDIPIIGSLNGTSNKGWIDYAGEIEQAGAQAIELNMFHIPTDFSLSSADVEEGYLETVKSVKNSVTIPVALKLSPFFTSLFNMAIRFEDAGADGFVLFNRFYQPDFDLEELKVVPSLELSVSNEIRLPLLWIALMHGRINASMAATTGVQSSIEVVKYLLAGASVTMTASAILRKGIGYISELTSGLVRWMEDHDYDSVAQMQGAMSQLSISDPETYERANYIKILESYEIKL